jgi:hypothetical protein
MNRKITSYIPARSSPRGSTRACLCKNKLTYSRDCCNQDIMNQGIGVVTKIS